MKQFDIIIIGAGPSGLSFALMAAKNGFKSCIIEKQPQDIIEKPQFDGRDIALTHSSKAILEDLGIWQYFAPDDISKISAARVLNGNNEGQLNLNVKSEDKLAYVVSNHLVREYCYKAAKENPNITIYFGTTATQIKTDNIGCYIKLENGEELNSKLLLAADTRFSGIRKQFGISASMYDFGKTMMVCRMKHEKPHNYVASECFHKGHTMAILPLNNDCCSAVITMKPEQLKELQAKTTEEFNIWVETTFKSQLGKMELVSERFSYPLVGVYANKFIAKRFALIGDAAVGMHPVTAHGFNFGLKGIETLCELLEKAKKYGQDIGSTDVLEKFDKKHRLDTLPLYLTTLGIVQLYTNDGQAASLARQALINLADKMLPIKALMMEKLVDDGKSKFPNPLNILPPLPKLPGLPKFGL